jgi:polyphosphate glucokinase
MNTSAGPATLAVDVGGTGIKASVLDRAGQLLAEPVRLPTTYPLPPDKLVANAGALAAKLPPFERISVGFPGMVRNGIVLSAPHFVTKSGPGSAVVPELESAWVGLDLSAELARALGRPAKVVNDADMQGAAVIAGKGLELVVTLGTGVGTGLFHEGRLAPHLELAHHPFRKGQTYNEQLGEAARRRVPKRRWLKRVELAVECLDALLFFDHLYLGGGNGKRVTIDLGPKVSVVDNVAGILGGVKVWEDWKED